MFFMFFMKGQLQEQEENPKASQMSAPYQYKYTAMKCANSIHASHLTVLLSESEGTLRDSSKQFSQMLNLHLKIMTSTLAAVQQFSKTVQFQ